MYGADSEFWWNGELSPTQRLDLMLIAGAGISSNEIRHMFIGARWEATKNRELVEKNKKLSEALQKWIDFTDRNIRQTQVPPSEDELSDWTEAYNESKKALKEYGNPDPS